MTLRPALALLAALLALPAIAAPIPVDGTTPYPPPPDIRLSRPVPTAPYAPPSRFGTIAPIPPATDRQPPPVRDIDMDIRPAPRRLPDRPR
ncbi:MAG: hypothetical protein ACN6N0_06010 [Microvirgula sp.]